MGKKAKVVFDTNVWISVFMQKIVSDKFSKVKQEITVYIIKDIIMEISKVLLYPKVAEVTKEANWSKKEILRALEANTTIVQPKIKVNITKDIQDNKILECALAAKADIIVSGDKHLTELGKYKKTKILTPREFFDEITG